MLLLLYTLAALALLWLVHRFVCRLSWGAAAFLFLLPFLFVGHALVANRVYAPVDKPYLSEPLSVVAREHGMTGPPHNPVTADIFSQMIPWRQVVRESILRGEWPLWNPYILSGDVLAAAAQPAPYSPFTLLAILLPAAISFTFTAAITFFVAGVCAFAFARELGCGEAASAIAAGGWAYSAAIALYVLWPLGLAWALFPLVLLGTRRVIHAPSVRSCALLTIAFTLLILAGHEESTLHIIALAGAYGLFELLCVRRNTLRAVGAAFAAGAIALLLCAIYLLPHLDAIPQTAEYKFRSSWKAKPRVDTPQQVLASIGTDFFPFLHLRRWIDPPVPGLKAESPAVGSIIVALAVFAVWRVRSKTTWFFAGATLFCLAAHAAWKPVAVLLHALPLFDLALNERLGFGAAFFLIILAAIGAEHGVVRASGAHLGDGRSAGGAHHSMRAPLDLAITFAIVWVVLAIGTWWITSTFKLDAGPRDWGAHAILAELALLGAAALIVATRLPMKMLVVVALLLAQRAITMGGVHKSFPAKDAYPSMPIFDAMKNVSEPFRVAGQGFALMPGTNALYGFEDVRGYEAMTFARYVDTYRIWCVPQPVFFNRVDDLSKPMLSMLNVRFAFAHESVATPPGWRIAAKQGEAVLFENTNAIARAFVPHSVKPGASNVIDEMANATDFRERAWIDAAGSERANGPGFVTTRRIRYGYELDATMDGDGWIVVSICDWKGWRAYIDGHRVNTHRANAAFIGIHAPAGRHRVRLVYWPVSFVTGRGITLATLLGLLTFAVIRRKAQRLTGSWAHRKTAVSL
ncbi:MAG: hypothetical protein DMF56_20785 [Acidobacteria bacterium]|nr:MAG: hypothetical protein DMF56_20785 [Acidobacteriota bacterium]